MKISQKARSHKR